jgi:hypothetical protein
MYIYSRPMYICMCMYMGVYVNIYAYTHGWMDGCMYVYMCIYVWMRVFVSVCIYLWILLGYDANGQVAQAFSSGIQDVLLSLSTITINLTYLSV